ncbi:MAG TPA: hypothetical protein VN725_02185 [Rhodanobacteraceae bacterium]|nr:hypothetical protein [Rhodanobacteraceae bacterium]
MLPTGFILFATFAFGVPSLAVAALILLRRAAARCSNSYHQREELLPRWLMYLQLPLTASGLFCLSTVFA